MIYSSGVIPYRNVSEEIKTVPNIQAKQLPNNVIQQKKTQFIGKDKQTQENLLDEKNFQR